MRFSDFLLVSDPSDLDFIVGYTEEQNIRISVADFFADEITGSGNAGYIPLFTAANVIDDSVLYQDGSNIVIGGEDSLGYRLAIAGSLLALDGAVIESSTPGSDTFRTVGEEGDSFIIPNDSDESVWTSRPIMHAAAVLSTESATLGQVNTAVSDLEGDIDILLDLKVDKSSVGEPNGVASLDATGKIPLSEIPDSIIGQVEYMGTWNAFTNTPTLNPLVPEEKGHYYVVSAAGVFGGVDYEVGDWIISNGVIWEKVDNTDAVTSVFGRIGAILALEGDYQAFYPRLSQAYDNPTWINSLAFTKITGVPPFLLENQTITLSGDVTGSGKTSISSTISNNAVSNEKLRDSVGTSVIGRTDNSTGDPADIQASTDGHVLLRSAGNLLFGLISSDSISSIDWSKITNTPTTLGGYGITDAYTKTESDNKFVPYTGANANVNLGLNSITANSFIKAGGTSTQFLKADGSVDINHYVPTTRSVIAGTGLTGGGNLSSDITIAFDTAYGDNRYAYRTRQLTINGITFDLSADRSWTVGTVNTLTTIGTSGPATLVGNTLNIPNYTTDLTGYVPYNGATANVNLGEYGFRGGYFQLDTTPTNTPTTQGTIFWDEDDNTIDAVLNGYIMKIGEDLFYPVKNQTGSTIAKGTAVRFAGTVGASGRLLIAPFIADGSVSSSFFMGVTAEAIADGEDGKVLWFGRIRGINTDAFNEGDVLYASTTVAGGFQTAVPIAPNKIVQVAAVITKSINQGVLFVRPSLGSNINNDEGVKIVSPTDGDLLQLQSSGLWENKPLYTVLTDYVTLNTTQTITAVKSFTQGVTLASAGGTNQLSVFKNTSSLHSGSSGSNIFGFNSTNNIYFGKGLSNGGVFNWSNSAVRYYTLQDADGTLAFLSDIPSLANYVTLDTNQTITGLKTILRGGDVLNFKIGTDTLYGLKIAYNQNELVPSGEATWSFVNTFNRNGSGFETTPISFFRGVLVTGERLLSASVNANLLDYYGNNPSGRYPIYAYNTGVQQFSSSIIVGETTGVVNPATGAIADLPAGVVANFKGRVIGSDAVNNNEFATLGQVTSTSRAAISLTTIGTSGPATYSSVTGVLNIPEYQGGVTSFNTRTGAVTLTSGDVTTALGYTPVTDARTLTINGESYDLTADRSWTVGVNPSAREIQTYIATASQTTFTVTGGYTVGLVDVFINGVRLTSSDYTATNGTTVVLTVGTMAGNIVDIIKYTSGFTNPIAGTLATGQVAFGTAANTIGGDAAFTWDNTNKILSVVKRNAGTALIVDNNGSFSFEGILIKGGNINDNFALRIQSSNESKKVLLRTNANGFLINVETSNNLEFATANFTRWIITNTGILQSNGVQTIQTSTGALTLQSGNRNVLINTTTDAGFRLDVNGTGRFSSTITAATLSTIGTAVAGQNVQLNLNGVSGKSQRIEFQNSGVQQWLIGAGAASETSAFEIFNSTGIISLSINKSNNAATFSSSITSSLTSGIFLNNSSGGTNATQIRINNTGGDARLGIESSTGGTIQLGTLAYAAVFGNQSNAATQFTTNGTARLTILGDGNVGIGTTAPTNPLHIVSNTLSQLNIQALSGNTNAQINLEPTGTGIALIGPANAVALAFRTDVIERMRITSGGNVLIGTTTDAGNKLAVAGGIAMSNNTDGNANLSYGGRISAKQTNVTGGAGATLIHRGLGSVGYFILVSGLQSSNRFTDLIYGTGSNTPIVLASNTENTAPTRTYSISGENIRVSLSGSADWIITTTGLGAMEA